MNEYIFFIMMPPYSAQTGGSVAENASIIRCCCTLLLRFFYSLMHLCIQHKLTILPKNIIFVLYFEKKIIRERNSSRTDFLPLKIAIISSAVSSTCRIPIHRWKQIKIIYSGFHIAVALCKMENGSDIWLNNISHYPFPSLTK